ncbi:NAD(P)/FAD-dependent oxidoreductase [soil metagenome]
MTTFNEQATTGGSTRPDLDAIVIGAGFAGIYALHRLRNELGLNARAFEKGDGIGGTWHWNRYPGAMSDTEGFVYRYSFDKNLLQEDTWDTKYLMQPTILKYLDGVVERHNLRSHIQLDTEVTAAHFDEVRNYWRVTLSSGESFTTRFVVSGLGLLSATNTPQLPAQNTFLGEQYHTSRWPEHVDLTGKRVAVIGTGSTGIQVITAIAPVVEHLTVFQRSAQYSVPSGNGPIAPEYVESVKKDYDGIWSQVRDSVVAFGFVESTVPAMSVSEEERQRVFQKAWEDGGGFRFMFGTFSDVAIDPEANEAAASFVRSKIAQVVKDPETARKLTPLDLYAKRPLCDSGYYETFNRDNVELVAIKENPITEVTPRGIKTRDGVEHIVDVIIYATGFDAVDGNFKRIDIRGREGKRIQEHWESGPSSYLGVSTAGYPNFFMVLGPNGPFTNQPPAIEVQVEWITDLIREAVESDSLTVEPTKEAEESWTETCNTIAAYTLFPKAASWIMGNNVPGKPVSVMFYMAGLGSYRQQLAEEVTTGYGNFFRTPAKTEESLVAQR